ncbi:sensor histidine kinase [Pimelobacter simplex]|uniref:sensor histidine kinase n=1 Tax=Nocardioides simplex TaxID=2045 RepID=UPI003AAD6CFE
MDEPSPDDYQPRLRWYGHLWRYLVILAISVLVWSPAVDAQVDRMPLLFWVDIVLGIVSYVVVGFRRRWPVPVAVATVLMTPFSGIAAGPATLATVSLATRRQRWQVLGIGILNLLGGFAYYAVQPAQDSDPWWLTATVSVALCAAIVGWGMYIGSRRELIWTLRQRAETAEAERDLRATQARSNERARIAREMHDVLAHRISQISMHAGALTYREDLSADEMRSSVTVIQAKAHEALRDLREVLGVLREAEGGGPLTGPQPTYRDLDALIDDAREAGTAIEYDDRLAPDAGELPDAVGRTVYRIVQEGITNAAKHARAATVRITLSGSPADGVDVVLRNALGFGPTRTPGAGLGLVGLTERAELRGGWLTHGVEHTADATAPDAFVLHAWLPWAAEQEEIPS